MTRFPELSVVIPVYGCAPCLRPLHEQLTDVLRSLTSSYEIVLVDDASVDGSWDAIRSIAREDPAVRPYRLSRNFGQQAAIAAGMAQSRGRWTVVMDCDLQDPPDVIPNLYAQAREGFDVVYGVRKREGTPRVRRLAATARARALELLTDIDIDTGHGCMTMMSREVVDAYLRIPDRERDHILILHWLGFDSASVEYTQAKRYSGKSSYSPGKLLRLAMAGAFFQTTRLLHWIVYSGFLLTFGGALLGLYLALARLTQSDPAPGWTSLALILLLFGGFIITITGIVGLYVGRVLEQVQGRPLYIIREEDVQTAEAREQPGEREAAADPQVADAERPRVRQT